MDTAYGTYRSAYARERTRRAADRLSRLARLLDSSVRIPGTRFTFGLDAMMSVVPVLGSFFGSAISAYVILEAYRLGAPRSTLAAMLGNIGVDTVLGAVPGVGFVFDAFYKANNRNVALLRRWLEQEGRL